MQQDSIKALILEWLNSSFKDGFTKVLFNFQVETNPVHIKLFLDAIGCKIGFIVKSKNLGVE